MNFQKQRFRHRPEQGEFGDCHRSAIACVIDFLVADVPNFAELYWDRLDDWHRAVDTFLQSHGFQRVTLCFNDDVDAVLSHMAYHNPDVPYILTGTSKNNLNHAVVCKGPRIIWDTSLDNSGIKGRCSDGYVWIEVILRKL